MSATSEELTIWFILLVILLSFIRNGVSNPLPWFALFIVPVIVMIFVSLFYPARLTMREICVETRFVTMGNSMYELYVNPYDNKVRMLPDVKSLHDTDAEKEVATQKWYERNVLGFVWN